MPLQSQLLKDDARLQACLVSDPAHVTPGSIGDFVSLIQEALFLTNSASIDGNELANMEYGPSTAQAVLDFKGPPRNILGPGQVTPDNIVGKLTIARLDAELLALEPPSVSFDLKVGSISWIEPRPNPFKNANDAIDFNPTWIPKAAMGLMACSNSAPPNVVPDFRTFKGGQDFRAITFCNLHVDVDGPTGNITIGQIDSFAEVGFTPAFSFQKLRQNGAVVGPLDEQQIDSKLPAVMRSIHAGELSSVSGVVVGGRHPNSAIAGVPDDPVLLNALVKVRASGPEDAAGVSLPEPGVPFHVPWVWCEILITHAGQQQINVFGRGSTFPSHAWYVSANQVDRVIQECDASFLVFPGTNLLQESAMILPPFFRRGAPASGSQTSLASEANVTGPVDTHPNAALGGRTVAATIGV